MFRLGAEAAVPFLCEALEFGNSSVRPRAAKALQNALGLMGPAVRKMDESTRISVRGVLRRARHDRDPDIRSAADKAREKHKDALQGMRRAELRDPDISSASRRGG